MEFTHIDKSNQPQMVDVSQKKETYRTALAQCLVRLPDEIIKAAIDGEILSKKGPVFQTAIIAGTMAAKRTSDLIPFCHPIGLEDCKIKIEIMDNGLVRIEAETKVSGKTGVEMEALTAASVAGLTIYDMCKAVSKGIEILETKLIEKTGGKSDYKNHS